MPKSLRFPFASSSIFLNLAAICLGFLLEAAVLEGILPTTGTLFPACSTVVRLSLKAPYLFPGKGSLAISGNPGYSGRSFSAVQDIISRFSDRQPAEAAFSMNHTNVSEKRASSLQFFPLRGRGSGMPPIGENTPVQRQEKPKKTLRGISKSPILQPEHLKNESLLSLQKSASIKTSPTPTIIATKDNQIVQEDCFSQLRERLASIRVKKREKSSAVATADEKSDREFNQLSGGFQGNTVGKKGPIECGNNCGGNCGNNCGICK